MAMPSTCIQLKACYDASACSSIGVAVCGTAPATSCLCSLARAAERSTTNMLAFAGYVTGSVAYHQIGFCNISATGTNGTTSRCSVDCICSNTAMAVGTCYSISLCHNMCSNTNTGSYSCIQVYCNTTLIYNCLRLFGSAAAAFSCTFTVAYGDTACVMNQAVHPNAGGTGISCAQTCITSVSNVVGFYCKTTGCSCCCVYTN